jgi:hypothetical protein
MYCSSDSFAAVAWYPPNPGDVSVHPWSTLQRDNTQQHNAIVNYTIIILKINFQLQLVILTTGNELELIN